MVTVFAFHKPGQGYLIQARGENGKQLPKSARPRDVEYSTLTPREAEFSCANWYEALKDRGVEVVNLGVVDVTIFDMYPEWK